MIQVIPLAVTAISYGAVSQTLAISGGQTDPTIDSGSGVPMLVAGTARNLTLYNGQATAVNTAIRLYKNGVATALTCNLPAGAVGRQAFDTTNQVAYAVGDSLRYRFFSSATSFFPGYSFGVSIELEGNQQQYGIPSVAGSRNAGQAWSGGSLGNGSLAASGSGTDMSVSYSPCGLAGVLDQLCIKRHSVSVGGGWRARIILNTGGGPVLQDGSGGTVETLVDLPDGSALAYAISAFSLPISPGDFVSTIITRYGSASTPSGNQVSTSCAVTPTTAGEFMLCGGSNDSIPNTGTAWKWNHSGQQSAPLYLTIGQHTAPVGQRSIFLTGIFNERGTFGSSSPGLGKSYTYTVLDNTAPTAVSVTQANLAGSASITGLNVELAAGHLTTIEIANVNSPSSSNYHWGIGLTVTPPAMTGTIQVDKVTDVASTDLFPFETVGLTPSAFNLMNGESQVFSAVMAGSGYGIAELVPRGWSVSYNVSNGSPIDNITVAVDEEVLVTVTNTQECPGFVDEPRLDGLPYVAPSVEPCEGTGTRGAPRIGA